MKKFTYTITDEVGIHARPAGMLVKEAQKFESNIILKNADNSKSGDIKKIFSVMGLGIKQNTNVEVICEGTDEEKAQIALEGFFKSNL